MTQKSGHTFAVSNVEPSDSWMLKTNQKAALEKVLGGPVEACSTPQESVVKGHGFHVLFETLHRAYDEHRPLILTPDNIWLTIAQGFAACVNQAPETYRHCFVSHEGKKEIRIRRDDFVMAEPENDWRSCFPEFSARIKEYIGAATHGLILANFSTTGDVELAASEVVLMDVVQNYFEYVVETRCGIPSITLEGTVEDWEKLLNKTLGLKDFGGLDWWLDKVIPVVKQFLRAAKGNIDTDFWEDIYKGADESGGLYARGELLVLLPYIRDNHGNTVPNPLLSQSSSRGLKTSNLPQALSCVPFLWDYHGQVHDYQFLAGHVGIAHDTKSDALRAVVGWAVRPAPQSLITRR